MQVAANDGPCWDSFFDAVRHVVRLLLAGGDQVVFDRGRFESAFALQCADAISDDDDAPIRRSVAGQTSSTAPPRLSRALRAAFFDRGDDNAEAIATRFPEGGLYVCVGLPPLGQALQSLQRAITLVSVKGAGHGSCDWYLDTVGNVLELLVGDGRAVHGPAVFRREKFESTLGLNWVE
ncbi:hypothetical protein PR202_ga15765 [Eleusine coracana subsp. coracana]|uniref:Uncharacterized protein n=1 Tax=Eleusine coracana subsp. coracana TaxID=191504 RepID=A0AAV5CL24_ELECO|nr:hypothetical protein PR202_ga15765 [Eleusine coracana subsp. coracana]